MAFASGEVEARITAGTIRSGVVGGSAGGVWMECTFFSAKWKRTQGARNLFRIRDCFSVREVAPDPEINAASADESACRFFLYNMQTGDELDFEFLGGHYLHTNVIVKGLTSGPGGGRLPGVIST